MNFNYEISRLMQKLVKYEIFGNFFFLNINKVLLKLKL